MSRTITGQSPRRFAMGDGMLIVMEIFVGRDHSRSAIARYSRSKRSNPFTGIASTRRPR